MFEVVVLWIVFVMYEGEYLGIFFFDCYYVLLDKKVIKLESVCDILSCDKWLDEIVECVYKDIIESDKYFYEGFINEFDR